MSRAVEDANRRLLRARDVEGARGRGADRVNEAALAEVCSMLSSE